jgi:hypothetical protein
MSPWASGPQGKQEFAVQHLRHLRTPSFTPALGHGQLGVTASIIDRNALAVHLLRREHCRQGQSEGSNLVTANLFSNDGRQ